MHFFNSSLYRKILCSNLTFTCCIYSLQLLTYGRRIPAAELFARIDAVDASTVKRVANRFIFDQVTIINCIHLCNTAMILFRRKLVMLDINQCQALNSNKACLFKLYAIIVQQQQQQLKFLSRHLE